MKVLRVGVCGTDLGILRGQRPDRALVLGHEGIGEVAAVGLGADYFEPGQVVVFNPVNPRDQNDILGHSSEGLFQEYRLVTEDQIWRGLILPFDPAVHPACGPLVEPLGTAVYGDSLTRQIIEPKRVAVVGAGCIGLLNAIYAKLRGCAHVFLINKTRERLRWAVEQSIAAEGDALPDGDSLIGEILERTNGEGVDAAYLCTPHDGAKSALRKASIYVREGGCINLVGGFADEDLVDELPGIDLNKVRRANICGSPHPGVLLSCRSLRGKNLWLTGHRGTSGDHLRQSMRILSQEAARFAALVTHVIPLEAAPRLIGMLAHERVRRVSGTEVIKVVIHMFGEPDAGTARTGALS